MDIFSKNIFQNYKPAVVESMGCELDFDISEFGLIYGPEPINTVWPVPPGWLMEMALESADPSESAANQSHFDTHPKTVPSAFESLDPEIDFEELTQFHRRVAALAKATVMLGETDLLIDECIAFFSKVRIPPEGQQLLERLLERRLANSKALTGLD